MSGRKRKLPSSFVPEPCLSEDEDGQWVDSEHLRHVPPVPLHLLRKRRLPERTRNEEDHHHHQQQQQQHDVEGEEDDTQEDQDDLVVEMEINDENLDDGGQEQDHEQEHEQESDHEQEQEQEQEQHQDQEQEQEQEEAEDQVQDADHDQDHHHGVEGFVDSEEEGDVEEQSFHELYADLTKDWMCAEIDHRVSKTASNEFWRISNKYFFKLYKAKEREIRRKKIPQYKQVRQTMYSKHVPPVSLEVAFRDNTTGEVILEKGTSTPISKYPPNKFSKLFEMASVEVNFSVRLFLFFRPSVPSFRPSVYAYVCACVRAYVRPCVRPCYSCHPTLTILQRFFH